MTQSEIAEGFNQAGGGTQYEANVRVEGQQVDVQWLLDHGYLREVVS